MVNFSAFLLYCLRCPIIIKCAALWRGLEPTTLYYRVYQVGDAAPQGVRTRFFYDLMTKLGFWSKVLKSNNKVAGDAAVGAAVIATGPLFISIEAAIVAEGYTISQLAKESVELGYLEKGGFVTGTLDVVGNSFMGEYATP
ncbi:hypothetical protein C2G38_2167465 [Gigaspora rosea]|uniref:Uncharacterized protein n=1 Tax=Gigaspora rosea TaxID=44941 RepID=A0A397VSY5_9GLOM|nr:hypothetical protein C2G38_2167465 [Gigaspora rosea]